MILCSQLQFSCWSFSLSWYFHVALTNSQWALLISSTSSSSALLSFSFISSSATNSGCWEAKPLLLFWQWDMILKLKLWAQDEKVWNDLVIAAKNIECLKRFTLWIMLSLKNMDVFSMFVIVKDGTNFKAITIKFQIVKIPNLRKKRVAELC